MAVALGPVRHAVAGAGDDDGLRRGRVVDVEESRHFGIRCRSVGHLNEETLHPEQRQAAGALERVAHEEQQRLAVRSDVVVELALIAQQKQRGDGTEAVADRRHHQPGEIRDGDCRRHETDRLEVHAESQQVWQRMRRENAARAVRHDVQLPVAPLRGGQLGQGLSSVLHDQLKTAAVVAPFRCEARVLLHLRPQGGAGAAHGQLEGAILGLDEEIAKARQPIAGSFIGVGHDVLEDATNRLLGTALPHDVERVDLIGQEDVAIGNDVGRLTGG